MARNKARKKGGADKNTRIRMEATLPQNILLMGESSSDTEKRIYISQYAYNAIHRFTKNKTENESGGMLVGTAIQEFGKTNIIIQGFVEAKYTEATPTTLKFTHDTWDYVHREIDRRFENGKIVGWIHTHPNFGIFLSEYDKFIQDNFFSEENQVAFVVDPIRHEEGFYCWLNGKLEHCKGFYVYDHPDCEIKISPDAMADDPEGQPVSQASPGRPLVYGLLILFVLLTAALALISYNLFNRISILESQQESLVSSANTAIATLQRRMTMLEGSNLSLQTQMSSLKKTVDEYRNGTEGEDTEPGTETQAAEPKDGEAPKDSAELKEGEELKDGAEPKDGAADSSAETPPEAPASQ